MTRLGKYELLEAIGRGAFAVVYRARHIALGREAAVKVLDADRLNDPRARERMEREARIAATLVHPNIVKIFDLIHEGETLAIAMEYLPGGSLRRWMEANRPSTETLLDLLTQVAESLDYIHGQRYQSDRPLLHRDVKPENVLIDQDAQTGQPLAKLSDFGLALDPQRASALTQAQGAPGTAYYIAPELAEGLPAESLDGRADQYSLAVMAYELLTGKRPFEGSDPVAVIAKRLEEDPPRPSEINPQTPFEFDQPLLKALQRKPEDRFSACAEFARALREAWQASLLRRVREQLEQARQAAQNHDFKTARAALKEAERILPDDPRIAEARQQIDRDAELAQRYEEALQNWQTALQKARAALDLDPNFPDSEQILIALGLRPPPRPPFDWRGWSLRLGTALLFSALAAALMRWLAILWILNNR